MDEKTLKEAVQRYLEREEHAAFRTELQQAQEQGDAQDLRDRFYRELAFGTAGMRGVIGGGTNRMNPLVVSTVTQGLANYLKAAEGEGLVIIAYDSRQYSPLFAETAARVLCANGIPVAMFSELRPVPMLSFTVRYLRAQAGIVVTASHNPAEYNGYKVYWSDGSQVTAPHDEAIVREVEKVRKSSRNVPVMELEEAEAQGLFSWIGSEVEESYYRMVKSLTVRPELFKENPPSVVFTPLHGAGREPVLRVLGDRGIPVTEVKEQSEPDGKFPTVENPNPEDPQAMELALAYARKHKADIVLGTDPDADRLGMAVPADSRKEDYQLLTGNQIAVLLCDYLYAAAAEKGFGGRTPVSIKSIVTTDLIRSITESYGGRCADVLTGFKHIAQVMKSLEPSDNEFFLFAAEESYGYLVENEVRDKDAVSAAAAAVEMAQYHRSRGVSLQERLEEIWKTFGYYEEQVISKSLPGEKGQQQIASLMEYFRKEVHSLIAGDPVVSRLDLLADDSDLPRANMLIYRLEGERSFMLRPSGTEPKVKCYLFGRSSETPLEKAQEQVREVLQKYEAFFEEVLQNAGKA